MSSHPPPLAPPSPVVMLFLKPSFAVTINAGELCVDVKPVILKARVAEA